MTKRITLIALPALALLAGLLFWTNSEPSLKEVAVPEDHGVKTAKGIQGAMDYYKLLRANVNTGEVELSDILATRKAAMLKAATQTKAVGLQWTEMGPDNIGGRTRAITLDPNDPSTIYAGGVSGGLWKSTDGANSWNQVTGFNANLIVSTIAFTGNGHLYVGTGSTHDGSNGSGGSGFVGGGLFRSDDGGASFTLVVAPSSLWVQNIDYAFIDKIAGDPNNPNGLWVGQVRGLEYYDETTGQFTTPSGVPANLPCEALEVSLDGNTIIASLGTSDPYLSTDGGQSFSALPTAANSTTQLPSNSGRMEFAISPDDANYIYAQSSTSQGVMQGIWGSTDRGSTWTQVWPSNTVAPSLNIFRNQGGYDNVIAVVPGHPDQFWTGGVSLWKGSLSGQPFQIAQTSSATGCFNCVHADVHEITWDLQNNIVYVGSDGGVSVGGIAGTFEFFYAANRGYNVTQFYGIAFSPQGKVVGGTQDNGNPYLSFDLTTPLEAEVLYAGIASGGDGFDADISQLDPNIIFVTQQNGELGRSADGGLNFGLVYSDSIIAVSGPIDPNDPSPPPFGSLGDFYTNIRLYENYNDPNSPNLTTFFNASNDTLFAGQQIAYRGRNSSIPMYHTLANDVLPQDSVPGLPDHVQSLLAVGFAGSQGLWVTRDGLAVNFSPFWWQVSTSVGNVNCLEWSADGDHLFVGNTAGDVYRVSGFNNVYTWEAADIKNLPSDTIVNTATNDTIFNNYQDEDYANNNYEYLDGTPVTLKLTTSQVYNGSAVITGLGPDPSNSDRLLITIGGYGGSGKVRLSNNATSANPTTQNVWNPGSGLTGMPVYDGIIHADNPNIFVVGTEFGIFSTDDGGSTWTMENDGMDMVPTFAVRQQQHNYQWPTPYGPAYIENPYVIYIGTHGRGIFRSETLLSVSDPSLTTPTVGLSGLNIYPNPTADMAWSTFTLDERRMVVANVLDMNGRIVRKIQQGSMAAGEHRIMLDVSTLNTGTYMLMLQADGKATIGRFVVQR